MKCKFCGNEVTKESSVCPCCGASLIKKQVTESMTKNDSYNPSVKKTTEMEVNAIQKTNINEQMNNIEIIESSKENIEENSSKSIWQGVEDGLENLNDTITNATGSLFGFVLKAFFKAIEIILVVFFIGLILYYLGEYL